jgi:membrane associated rhomboid family serine protease
VLRSAFGSPLGRRAPVLTIGAIVLCVATFIGQQVSGGELTADWVLLPGIVWYEPWSMVTAAFLHGGLAHLLLNMYALWVVGGFVERLVGRARFAVLYIGSALGGHAAVLLYFRLADFTVGGALAGTLGASGAVFGLFAAAFVLSRRLGGDIRGLATVIALNLVLSVMLRGISWQAHIGGLLMGAALAAVYAYAPRGRRRLYAWFAAAGAAVLLTAIVVATVSPWAMS